jgi:hypothetical protein
MLEPNTPKKGKFNFHENVWMEDFVCLQNDVEIMEVGVKTLDFCR